MAWEPLRLPRSHDSVCHPEPLPVVLALPSTSPTHATGAEPPALPRAASPVVKRGRRPLRGQRLFDTALLVSEAANRAAAWPYTPPELDPVDPPCPLSSSLGRPRSSLLLPPEAHIAKQSLQDLKIELLRATVRAFDETLCCSPTKEAEPAGASADASDSLAAEEVQGEGAAEEQVLASEASIAEAAAQGEGASAAGVERELPSEVSTVLDELDPAIVEAYHALPVRKKAAPPLPAESPSRVESLRQALELDERFLGVHSPFLLPLLCGLGCALVKAGKAEEALVLGERATEILLRELAQLMETHGAYECACKLYRMRRVVAIECFSDSSLQRMAAAHDLAMILLHVYKIKRPRRDVAAARSLSLAMAKGRSSSSLNDSSSSEEDEEEVVNEEASAEEDEALREARQGAALWMTDVNLSDAITPLHINFANVQEAYDLLQECLMIEANHSRIGDDGTSKPRAFPDWLADFNPEEIDDTRWWWSIGDSTRLGLCEIRQLRGDWQGAMDDLYRMSCVQQKREGTDPEQKLMVFGRLADLARRYDSSLAVWPLEQTLDVLLTEVRPFDAPDKLQEVKDELIELLCHLGRHAAVTRILNKCGDELQSATFDTSMRRMQIVHFNQQQAAMLLQRVARGMLARSRRSMEERAAVSAQARVVPRPCPGHLERLCFYRCAHRTPRS
ncbi:hypothetical protein AB1Y20_008678 [Prymnesium parvum]|uniref:Tetratricopeptide repeat-containing protein n=1 Tax=Prymnesium parvum TaxID=97485 RepID=A0AB34ITZ0_PRYPA